MKYYILVLLFIAFKCNTPKVKTVENNQKEKKEIKETSNKKEITVTKEKLLLTIKNPKKVNDAKALVVNSGLIWDKLVIDKNSLKVAIIQVPIEKKEFWISKLKKSNIFSSVAVSSKASMASIQNNFKNKYITIRKSKCFGDCPVYEVVVSTNGTLIFNGFDNVIVKGITRITLTESEFKSIKDKFNKTAFGTYFDSYADKALMDYPSTFITHKDKEIEIKLWKNVPEELALAYEAIQDILYQKKLIE